MSIQPCVYILASGTRGTLYVGVTGDLLKRVWQHKSDLVEGFSKRHGVHLRVWFEMHASMESAIRRETAVKNWKRAWKLRLIESENAEWRDLYTDPTCSGIHFDFNVGPTRELRLTTRIQYEKSLRYAYR